MSRLCALAALVVTRGNVAALQRNAERTGHPERAHVLALRKAEIDDDLETATMVERVQAQRMVDDDTI
jgi:hypothetical protein